MGSKKADRRRVMSSPVTHTLHLSPTTYSDQTSFRIGGSVDGEVDLLCRSLGLSGPEDFEIPAAVWEASFKKTASPAKVSIVSSSPVKSLLVRPPSMKLPVRSFAPPDENSQGCEKEFCGLDEEEEEKVRVDDSSSGAIESTFFVSPNGRIKRIVGSWMRGQFLGSGSFGTVYEGISE